MQKHMKLALSLAAMAVVGVYLVSHIFILRTTASSQNSPYVFAVTATDGKLALRYDVLVTERPVGLTTTGRAGFEYIRNVVAFQQEDKTLHKLMRSVRFPIGALFAVFAIYPMLAFVVGLFGGRRPAAPSQTADGGEQHDADSEG